MTTALHPDGTSPPAAFGIADLRQEMQLTQSEFGQLIGLKNKASVSQIESGMREPVPTVALKIEQLSVVQGRARIDAAQLNAVVAASRAACPGGCMLGSALEGAAHG